MNTELQKGSSTIYKAILKYGHSNFKLEILEYCDKNILIEKEQYYLDLLKPEYNICKIAGSNLGYRHSEKTRKAMSMAQTGRKHSEKTKRAMSVIRMGSRHTEETIQKFREKIRTIETKLKLSSRCLGVKVKILDSSKNQEFEFSSMKKAAQYLGIRYQFISEIFHTGISYKNYILEFEVKDLRI
jgi:group I intron endonuclease